MEELIYQANIDYELQLYFDKRNWDICHELESILFFLYPGTFFTTRKYSKEFLDRVSSANSNFKLTNKNIDSINLWGSLDNKDLEKKLNSKLTSQEIARELKCNTVPELFEMDQLQDFYQSHHKIIIKDPYDFSGRGNIILEYPKSLPKLTRKKIIQKYVDIDTQLGVRVSKDGIESLVINITNSKGNIQGLLYQKSLEQKYEGYFPIWHDIYSKYNQLGATSVQIDSFVYSNKLQALSEVNHRKTMGDLVKLLNYKFAGNAEFSLLLLIPVKPTTTEEQSTIIDWGVIPLSDSGNKFFNAFFISHNDKNAFWDLIQRFSKLQSLAAGCFKSIDRALNS